MPVIDCPHPQCDFSTPDVMSEQLAATLLQIHASGVHAITQYNATQHNTTKHNTAAYSPLSEPDPASTHPDSVSERVHDEMIPEIENKLPMPPKVQLLLVPNPVDGRQEFANNVVNELFAAVYRSMTPEAFLKYATDQREDRSSVMLESRKLLNLGDKLKSSADGHWQNVRLFSEPTCSLNHGTLGRAKNTVGFLNQQIDKCTEFIDNISKRRMKSEKEFLLSKKLRSPHKANEVKFFASMITEVTPVLHELQNRNVVIKAKLHDVNPSVHSIAGVAESKRLRKREHEMRRQNIIDTVKRSYKSAVNVLEKLEYSGDEEVLDKINNGNFNFMLDESLIKTNNFNLLRQKMHLSGLKLLENKGFFGVGSSLSVTATKHLKLLEDVRDLLEKKKQTKPNSASTSSKTTPKTIPKKRSGKVQGVLPGAAPAVKKRSTLPKGESNIDSPPKSFLLTKWLKAKSTDSDADDTIKKKEDCDDTDDMIEDSDGTDNISEDGDNADMMKKKDCDDADDMTKKKENADDADEAIIEVQKIILIIHPPCYRNCFPDRVAAKLVPTKLEHTMVHPTPLETAGDGNCLFNAASLFLCARETYAPLLRRAVSSELIRNAKLYASHAAFVETAMSLPQGEDQLFLDLLSIDHGQEQYYITKDRVSAIKAEGRSISSNYTYCSLVAIFALSSVLHRPIYSVYPDVKYNLRKLFHQLIRPVGKCLYHEPLYLLWSRCSIDSREGAIYQPNHFVPIVDVI